MNIFSKVFGAIGRFFTSGKAKKDAETAIKFAVEALPYIKIAGDIIVGITPTGIDDVAWKAINAKYPKLFDGSIHTPDELKSLGLGVAVSLLESKFPKLNTTIATLATQIAFTQLKANGEEPKIAPPSNTGILLTTQPAEKSPLSL